MSTDKEKSDQFEWWITCIPDKVEYLKKYLNERNPIMLDYSKESLEILGSFVLTNFTLESMRENKELWDAIASYIGNTYKKHFSNAYWYLELKDKKNLDYNKPKVCHRDIPVGLSFIPHTNVLVLIDRKKNKLWSDKIDKDIIYIADFIKKYRS